MKLKTAFYFFLTLAAAAQTNLPIITNDGGASNMTTTAGTLNCYLSWTGAANPVVAIYWGTTAGGTNKALWSNSVSFGSSGPGHLSTNLTGLSALTKYFYRAYASNRAGGAWAADTKTFWTLQGTPSRTVMVDSNGVVMTTNFWENNFFVIEPWIEDLIEGGIDTIVPDYLADYLTRSASDIRYKMRGGLEVAEDVLFDGEGFTLIDGVTVQEALHSIDEILASIPPPTPPTTNSTGTNVVSGSTNASDIHVSFTPGQYTPSSPTVEEHLRSIDSRLGYLFILATNGGGSASTVTLASVSITGAATIQENTSEPYTLTAFWSDGTNANVTTLAAWNFNTAVPSGTTLSTNTITAGNLAADSNIVLRGQFSWNGVTRSSTKNITLDDTNTTGLLSVWITGTNTISENQSALYSAFASYSNGPTIWTQDVTQAATWSLAGAAPTNTSMVTNRLVAGEVDTNVIAYVVAQYSLGGPIVSATNAVTILNTNQIMQITFNYSGKYSSGTLYVEAFDNNTMQGFPIVRFNIPNYNALVTPQITNIPIQTVRYKGSGQYQGQTYWFAFLDTDGSGGVNGNLASASGPAISIRKDEPFGQATGQTATSGVSFVSNQYPTITFTLTEWSGSTLYTAQSLTEPVCSEIPQLDYALVKISESSAMIIATLTNRTYFCPQDFMVRSTNLCATGKSYQIYKYYRDNYGSSISGVCGWGYFNNF